MLTAGTTEAHERALARIHAARHRHLRDRLRHARVRDLDESRGHLLGRAFETRRAQLGADRVERGGNALARERKRKAVGLHAAEREIRIRERELARPVAPITERAGLRARALGSNREAEAGATPT